MPNYIINECLSNDEYILSAVTLTSGATVLFSIGMVAFCGTVGTETESSETSSISFGHLYDDCCACLSDITEFLNFQFKRCGTEDEINIDAGKFCLEYGLPTTGLTYEIRFYSETPFCATFKGLVSSGSANYSYVSGPSLSCEDCENPPPISAGTEYNVCVIDCSGNTVSISPPHPTWTNEQGHAVVLLDAIALGGINGLNS